MKADKVIRWGLIGFGLLIGFLIVTGKAVEAADIVWGVLVTIGKIFGGLADFIIALFRHLASNKK